MFELKDKESDIYFDEDDFKCTRCGRIDHNRYQCKEKTDIYNKSLKSIKKKPKILKSLT